MVIHPTFCNASSVWVVRHPKSFRLLVAQHCDPPYRTIGYSYTHRIYVFQGIAGYRAIPPPPKGGVSHNYVDVLKARGGGVSQVKAALSAIGRYRGVSQLYCRKSRFNGRLSSGFDVLTDSRGRCEHAEPPKDTLAFTQTLANTPPK